MLHCCYSFYITEILFGTENWATVTFTGKRHLNKVKDHEIYASFCQCQGKNHDRQYVVEV